jgi:hypothetical protein
MFISTRQSNLHLFDTVFIDPLQILCTVDEDGGYQVTQTFKDVPKKPIDVNDIISYLCFHIFANNCENPFCYITTS